MNATVSEPTGPPRADSGEPDWELVRQWSRAWRVVRWSIVFVIVAGFLLVIGQGFLFYRLFADIHPVLGIGFALLLLLLLAGLVGRPLIGFLRQPVIVRPPAERIDPVAPDPAAIARRATYHAAYLKALARHPRFSDSAADIEGSRQQAVALGRQAQAAPTPVEAKSLLATLVAFETAHIAVRLAPLDAEADKLIKAEAVAVGVATAVSMNGTVDAFIVLWRNANLVARIARIYGGRPDLRTSLSILRDVAAVVVIARALEDVTDLTGDLIGSMLGRMGGLVAGPVMDGAINAMMTLKIGYLARRRCRSFEGWSPRDARRLSATALQAVKQASGGVLNEVIQRCGGLAASAAKATEKAMAGSKSAWSLVQGWFGVRPADP